jgi:hypothetical protein
LPNWVAVALYADEETVPKAKDERSHHVVTTYQ